LTFKQIFFYFFFIILKEGQLSKKFGETNDYFVNPILIKNDKTILSFSGEINVEWNPQNHFSFPYSVRSSISLLLLVLKRLHKDSKIQKIPKFVCFEIFKFLVL
jgi:hypothetical protein